MRELPNVALICADCVNHGAAIAALRKSLEHIKPGAVFFFTDREFNLPGIKTIVIEPLKSKRDYSKFILKDLAKYIWTDYVLIVQGDGYVICGDQWDDEFLNFDLLGAPWPYDHDRRIGNGGASLRSFKLLKAIAEDDFIDVLHPEDQSISIIYKFYLEEKYDIKFAPEELASKFSYELIEPTSKTFCFHGWHWPPFQETVVIKRTSSLGDVVMVQPVLEYFHEKGYRVVLDTLPQFFELFRNHFFPIHYKPHFNPNIPYKEYNLDMSYESDPKKLHLKAYYEFCGIPESEQVIRNPKLNVVVDKSNTLFPQKYVVLHLDKRSQPGRNQYGIDWSTVVRHLNQKGYLVIQIGKGESEDIKGVVRMNTLAEPMMVYLLAGCEGMIAVDSGPANVAVALGKKLIVFHGAVNPDYIWPDRTNIRVITNHSDDNPVCNNVYCWSSTIGCEGVPCYVDYEKPPCTRFSTHQVINAINELI